MFNPEKPGSWEVVTERKEREEEKTKKPAIEPTIEISEEISDEFIDITDPNDEHLRSPGEPSAEALFVGPMETVAGQQAEKPVQPEVMMSPEEIEAIARAQEAKKQAEMARVDAERKRIAAERAELAAIRERLKIEGVKQRGREEGERKVEEATGQARKVAESFVEDRASPRDTKPEDTTVN